MRLKKIKTLKKYKAFNDFSWQLFMNNEVFHDEFNLVFGENGSGKSSIVNLLKDISDNKSFIKYIPKEACLVFESGTKKYTETAGWDSKVTKGSILFFDREFVDKNVHLGHKRDTTQYGQEQESGKMIIEFDSKAIGLRNIRDKHKEAKDSQDQKVKDYESENEKALSFALTDKEKGLYSRYKSKNAKEIDQRKKELIKKRKILEKDLELDQHLQQKSADLQKDLKTLNTFGMSIKISDYNRYQSLFDFDLKQQTKINAEQSLVEKISEHKSFFEKGFEIRIKHKNQCPFCQSKSEENQIRNIIDIYEKIYDSTYKTQLKTFEIEKNKLRDEIKHISDSLNNVDLQSLFLELKSLEQKYKIPNIYSTEDEKKINKPKTNNIDKLNTKIEKLGMPSKENVNELYNKVNTELEAIKGFFNNLNNYIEEKNKIINKFQLENTDKKLQTRINSNNKLIEEVTDEIDFLNLNKIKEQKTKEQKEKNLKKLKNTFAKLRRKHEIALNNYEKYCSTEAFSRLLTKIEDYFKEFNFNFKLELKTEPTGNKVEYPFAFKVLDANGDERDFEDGLSEGEIQVLSLCFFFAFLDIQDNKDLKILAFDDPITSLDNNNLSCLVDFIAEKKIDFAQTFVFTHHRTFFKFLRKRFNEKNDKGYEYNLIRNEDAFGGSFICKSKSNKFLDKLKNFETHLASIPPQSLDIELKVVEYGQCLRYEIERYIKNTLLHWDADSDFTKAIEGVKTNKTIFDSDLDKIKSIYEFCNWTTSHIDVGEDYGVGLLKKHITEFLSAIKYT
ncbi:hypothetical protein A2380_01540 [candidate division WWE3 bacterium RIFOXYB1_FULL_43_24]|uniref:Protein CR006 P-loop domain-containing protein n=1 Tax=candidate division WWE3 bacterium GW2011_GWF1_42_14 TaxID=1619138 RepID=A0A0G1AUF5_UNCKA|nr:MAG: hypothetical protein UU92_C0010G0015 [candidate division WWE3 bacterium GW2011_GWA1_42_12]KKS34535.1 MAG: hypothetical protein UU97_C0009G0015 [candidate division WWE3 bacterium GW2011_GWD1_42_14]KKS37716.1 MAG: hypothetical protein UV00_C0012G0015 [candidate division WWE3 bacterium GW2011_GWF1_42_14]KKS40159.1 MAG: hypothetical protein UV03_C0011G0015 [candidate division WWE3 bacterium GW2011_GWE1_42_16]OGC68810.1 MAG: hypothetical protein A2380_01540 [candidate division WWE3 bacterium